MKDGKNIENTLQHIRCGRIGDVQPEKTKEEQFAKYVDDTNKRNDRRSNRFWGIASLSLMGFMLFDLYISNKTLSEDKKLYDAFPALVTADSVYVSYLNKLDFELQQGIINDSVYTAKKDSVDTLRDLQWSEAKREYRKLYGEQ